MNLKKLMLVAVMIGSIAAVAEEGEDECSSSWVGVNMVKMPTVTGHDTVDVVLSAPWWDSAGNLSGTEGDEYVCNTNTILAAGLEEGDELFLYSEDWTTPGLGGDGYGSFRLNKNKVWEQAHNIVVYPMKMYAPDRMKRQYAMILRMSNFSTREKKVVYFAGNVPPLEKETYEVTIGSHPDKVYYSLVSYPWATGKDGVNVNDIADWESLTTQPTSSDQILILNPSTGNLDTYKYNNSEQKWGVKTRSGTWKYTAVLHSGVGFWYLRKADAGAMTIAMNRPQ